MNVLGYLDRWSVLRGDTLELKVSSTVPEFHVDIVRFDHFFSEPDLARDRVIESPASGVYPGRVQHIPIGSWAMVPTLGDVELTGGFTVQCWLQRPAGQHAASQCVIARWDPVAQIGFRLSIDPDGYLVASFRDPLGAGIDLESAESLVANRWYFVALRLDPIARTVTLDANACKRRWLSGTTSRSTNDYGLIQSEMSNFDDGTSGQHVIPRDPKGKRHGASPPEPVIEAQNWLPEGDFLLGAGRLDRDPKGRPFPQHCLNGKIDRPACWNRSLTDDELLALETGAVVPNALPDCLAAWDLAQNVSTSQLVDISGHEHHGVTFNRPMRAVVGANWDGTATSIAENPAHYGAIAFHQDDLDDCGWETDLVVETDPSWSTGIYAARIEAGGELDYIPFYVRPRQDEPKANVLFLAPTNTYLAYGNEKLINALWDNPDFVEKSTDTEVIVRPMDQYLLDHPELGASIYDRHPDGSGICFSSRLRPLLTMRPQYVMWMHGLARHFSADLYLIEWLEANGISYDVATDEDLHLLGEELLADYSVILTGGHPEYWTSNMLETLESYLSSSGKMMYLGGNGFYWVTAVDASAPHFIEVRRGVNGIRTWTSHPGEVTLATTGEQGGLWRYRGKAPNSLCGIGFAAEGWGGAPGYSQTEQRGATRASFIFDGIAPDEIIGDFGFIMGGAAGDEIDRMDYALGTPEETLRLATTELRHSDYYQLVVEDCSFVLPGMGGTEEPRVRSDITYLEDLNGGAVFSVGSINWVGSLMWNGGNNNVSKMTLNVLRSFAGLA